MEYITHYKKAMAITKKQNECKLYDIDRTALLNNTVSNARKIQANLINKSLYQRSMVKDVIVYWNSRHWRQ